MSTGRNNTQYVAVIALIVSMIIWSVSGIAIKHALVVFPPFTMIVLRFVPSVLLMFIIGAPIYPDTTQPRAAETERLLNVTHETICRLAGIEHNTWPSAL